MVTASRLVARGDGCRALSLPTKPYANVWPRTLYVWLSLVTVLAAVLRLHRLDLREYLAIQYSYEPQAERRAMRLIVKRTIINERLARFG